MSTPIVKCGWLLRLSSVLKRWKKNYFVLFVDGNLSYYEDDTKREKHGNINLLFNGDSTKTALECSVEPPQGRKYGCLMTIVCKDKEEVTICAETTDECLAWKMMVEQPISARARGFQPGRPPQQVTYSTSNVQYVHTYPRRYGRHHRQVIVQSNIPQQTVYQCPAQYPVQQPAQGNPPKYSQQPAPGNPSQYPHQQMAGNAPQYSQQQGQGNPQQQQAPVYNYPNYGPVQVLYTTDGRPYYVHPHTQVIHVIHDDDPYYYRGNGMMYGMAAGALLGAAMWTPFLFF